MSRRKVYILPNHRHNIKVDKTKIRILRGGVSKVHSWTEPFSPIWTGKWNIKRRALLNRFLHVLHWPLSLLYRQIINYSFFNNTWLVSSVPYCVISQIGGWDGWKVTIYATAHSIQDIRSCISWQALSPWVFSYSAVQSGNSKFLAAAKVEKVPNNSSKPPTPIQSLPIE